MSLSPRAIALQGIGFAVLLVAVQGFAPIADPVPSPSGSPVATGSGGGGLLHQRSVPSAPKEFHDAVKQGRIRQDDEDLTVLVTAFLRIMT